MIDHPLFDQTIQNFWKKANTMYCMTLDWETKHTLPKVGPFPYSKVRVLSPESVRHMHTLFQDKNWQRTGRKRQQPVIEYIIELDKGKTNAPLFYYDSKGLFFGFINEDSSFALDLSAEGQILLENCLIPTHQPYTE